MRKVFKFLGSVTERDLSSGAIVSPVRPQVLEVLLDFAIFSIKMIQGSPDSTNFAPTGDHTIAKIVLNGE